MEKKIYNLLNKIEKQGYEAYVVGGYVRDYLLNEKTLDIDIASSATPEELSTFLTGDASSSIYGAFHLSNPVYHIDITTFRKEISYENRHPKVEFTKNLKEDLIRRDFTINALALTKEDVLIDEVGGLQDINKKVIRSLGNPYKKMKEDPLRILRAIRFATKLKGHISFTTHLAIKHNKREVLSLSPQRIRQELDLILEDKNYLYGLKLLKKYKITKLLGISYKKIKKTTNVLGMYAQMSLPRTFYFTKEEKRTLNSIQRILSYGKINHVTLYKEGLTPNEIASEIVGLEKETLETLEGTLMIHSPKDLHMDKEIINKKYPKKMLKHIYEDILNAILLGHLQNKEESIKEYVDTKEGIYNGGEYTSTKK